MKRLGLARGARLPRLLFLALALAASLALIGYRALFSFRWYSAAGRGGRIVTAYTHGALLAFFARRHGQGERLRLLVLDVHREQPFAVGALYVVARTADDTVPAGERLFAHGKAGFNCPGRSIFVWSMTGGMPARGAGAPTALSSSAPPTPTR